MSKKPLIAVPASVRTIEMDMSFHGNGKQYMDAIAHFTDASCCTIPALDSTENALAVLDHVDGVLLTGGTSNIHPRFYQDTLKCEYSFFDEARDRNSFAIIRKALDQGIPMFGICRGIQEINVALGGTLHQELHEIPGKMDHRSNVHDPLPEQFHSAHEININPGGILRAIAGADSVMVNSSHMQAIDRLADGLLVEATSEDRTIEAISVKNSPAYSLAVQFHPEWHVSDTPFYMALFQAFSEEVKLFARSRTT
jgi:putative glutamine amidotransferase